jgi:ribonuclease D
MVRKHGPEIWQILNTAKNSREKITPQERKIMADNYKQKIKQLKKEKGL